MNPEVDAPLLRVVDTALAELLARCRAENPDLLPTAVELVAALR